MSEGVVKLREDYLNNLRIEYPQMRVHYINELTKVMWPKEHNKELKTCSPVELSLANLYRQIPSNIILDSEEKYKLPEIKEKLNQKKWNYEVWDTGSRGYHIYITFNEMKTYDLELRNRIRKYIIGEFNTDEHVAKESQWISMPWTAHFKTGNVKSLIESVNDFPDNKLDDAIVNFCKAELAKQKEQIIIDDEVFKELYKTEPYLKFALNNIITDGGRNDVLFKNLAVLLVKSGLSNEDIMTLITKIIEHCPGKNINEFLGWIAKVKDGVVKEFNKFELVNWSLQYGHPPLYEIVDDSEYVQLLDVKQLWDIIWENRITAQPIWKDLAFYNMLSAVLDEREDDLRFHVIFSSYSSSGKDEGLTLIQDVLKDLGLKTHRPGEATDRTLVGSINQFAIEYNIKNGLSEEVPVVGTKEYKDPREQGILASANWLAFGEAESVFKPGAHNQKVQLYLRQAMDKSRQIEKGVGGITLMINTNTTLCLTTYTMSDIISKILHNGLFQRAVFYDKIISNEDHKKIVYHVTDHKFNSLLKERYDEKKYFSTLVDKLKTIKLWFAENKKKIVFVKDTNVMIKYKWDELHAKFDSLTKLDRDIMQSMVRRNATTLYKLAILMTTWKMKTDVEVADIEYGFTLIETCINSIKYLLINTDKQKKIVNGVLSLLRMHPIPKMNLYAMLIEQMDIKSLTTQRRIIEQLELADLVKIEKNGTKDIVIITEKGRRMLGLDDE